MAVGLLRQRDNSRVGRTEERRPLEARDSLTGSARLLSLVLATVRMNTSLQFLCSWIVLCCLFASADLKVGDNTR